MNLIQIALLVSTEHVVVEEFVIWLIFFKLNLMDFLMRLNGSFLHACA